MAIQRVIVALLTLSALAELFGIVFAVGPWRYTETICYLKLNSTLVCVGYIEGELVVPLNPLLFSIGDGLDMHDLCSRSTIFSTNKTGVACSCCKFVVDYSRIVFSNIVIGLVLLGSLWTVISRSKFEVL